MHEEKTLRHVLVIGGACGDMLLGVPRMPLRGEDVEAKDNGLQIGGCAFNVARAHPPWRSGAQRYAGGQRYLGQRGRKRHESAASACTDAPPRYGQRLVSGAGGAGR